MTATEQGATLRPITAEDLYRFTFVSDPQLSPDGRTVAFVRTTINKASDAYRSQVWVVPADASRAARRFTAGPLDSAPRWSPDGTLLAFLRRNGGKAQLWLIGAAGGEAWQLTDAKEGVADPQWSPDGKRIAFTSQVRAEDDQNRPASTDPVDVQALTGKQSDARVIDKLKYKMDGEGYYDDRRRHLFVVTVQGQGQGETQQLTSGEYNEGQPAWSPDGKLLAFLSARHEGRDRDNRSDVWTIAVDEPAAQPQRVTRTTGPCANPSFSPDGYWVAYTGHDNSPDHGPSTITGLWLVPANGSAAPRNLAAALDRPVGSGIGTDARYGVPAARPSWTPDGEILAFVSDRGDVPLLRFDAETGESRAVLAGRRQITNVSASADGRRLAYAVSSGTQPADLFVCDLDAAGVGAGEHRLTDVNGAFFAEVAIRTPQKYSYRAADGAELDAWVITPPGFDPSRKYPLVLEIHGGPQALYGESFYHEFQLLAGQGYVVLYTNPRGSDGYGQGFVSALRNDWGGVDHRDVLAGVDWLVGQGFIDESKMGITGGSYGGYLTNWIIGQDTRFAAAISGRSTSDRYSHYGHSDIGSFTGDWAFGGPPWERAQFYLARSPLTYVANVRTPLLLEHQENDLRCPVPQAEEFYTALKKLGREVQLVRFPDESHEMSRAGKPSHRVERLARIGAWFGRYLG